MFEKAIFARDILNKHGQNYQVKRQKWDGSKQKQGWLESTLLYSGVGYVLVQCWMCSCKMMDVLNSL